MKLEFEGDDAFTFLGVRSVLCAGGGWFAGCLGLTCLSCVPFSTALTAIAMGLVWFYGVGSAFSSLSQGAYGWRKGLAYAGLAANLGSMGLAVLAVLAGVARDIEGPWWEQGGW